MEGITGQVRGLNSNSVLPPCNKRNHGITEFINIPLRLKGETEITTFNYTGLREALTLVSLSPAAKKNTTKKPVIRVSEL